MEILNPQKDATEAGGQLRLVSDAKGQQLQPDVQKQFINFMFLRVSPEWRKLDPQTKETFKTEFMGVYESFADEFLLFSYSLVGFDSKADLMLWRIGTELDPLQEMTARLYRT